ncbi:MAG: DEAD/DEAH box helicase [Patescibacteria group bacterium]|jgi:superfamily II DNA/RNA helicase
MRKRSFGSGRSSFSRSNRFSGGGKNFSQHIDSNRYVRHAVPIIEHEVLSTMVFESLPINPRLKSNIHGKGYRNLTPIQEKLILPILEGRDVIGMANTGTGKTGAFLIPLIERTVQVATKITLILVPTRELAFQVNAELQEFSAMLHMRSALCIGGESIHRQMSMLREHPQFIIGTPGRMLDLLKRRALSVTAIGFFVLDEVDRMLDMGFVNDIKNIIRDMPAEKQSLFFSATMSSTINSLAHSFMRDPLTVSVVTRETAENVEQNVVRVQGEEGKLGTLSTMLTQPEFKKVLIFGRTKHGVERLSKTLQAKGFKAASIHGNKQQNARARAIKAFKEDMIRVLVATDVAARGLDIPDITHVINYDEPATYEDYIHRIGRTGRGNQLGNALTFIG